MNEQVVEIAIKLANSDKRTIVMVHTSYNSIYFLYDNGHWEQAVVDNTIKETDK